MQAVKSAVGSKKGGKLRLKDFMLDIDRYESHDTGTKEGKKKRMKEIKNKFLQWAKLHNKAVLNKQRKKK